MSASHSSDGPGPFKLISSPESIADLVACVHHTLPKPLFFGLAKQLVFWSLIT